MNTGDSAPVIEVKDLTRTFGKFTAVDHISFEVGRGEIFGFLGPNGAGKSTTIRMLCGLIASSGGAARVGGFDINRQPEMVRQNIGYMSQKFSLYQDLTVAENIAFFGGVYGLQGARLRERAAAVAALAGLEGMEDRLTGALSGAIRQRLALGCAIIHQPPILFLDEPTSGVDPISRRLFWDQIRTMARHGVTVMITTHFLDEAEFCHRLAFIMAGKLVALDTPGAIKRDAVPEDLFEVSLHATRGARQTIEQIDGVLAVSYFGSKLHMFCARGRYSAASLSDAIKATGLAPDSVEPAQIRLEDAFVRLALKQPERPAS